MAASAPSWSHAGDLRVRKVRGARLSAVLGVCIGSVSATALVACTVREAPDRHTESTTPHDGKRDAAPDVAAPPPPPADGGAGGGTSLHDGSAAAEAGGPDGSSATLSSVSGKLGTSGTTFVDSDTADPGRVLRRNDTTATAQLVASQSTVSGYLGNASDGAPDTADRYVVDLAAGQTATLYIGARTDGSPMPDFDLTLYDDTDTVVLDSTGTGPVESVQTTTAGRYTIEVTAKTAADAGLYALVVGVPPTAATVRRIASDKLSSRWPLVPGEALVKLAPGTNAAVDRWSALGVHPLGSGHNAIGYTLVALDSSIGGKSLGAGTTLDAWQTLDAIKRLRRTPGVTHAEPNYVRRIHALPPNDPLYPRQWSYGMVSMLAAWDHTQGAGATVAVLDTGVRKNHPDLVAGGVSQLLAGYDMIRNPAEAADGDGRDSNSDDPGDRELQYESSWHGTHVSGTIAAATNNGIGCAGIAPAAKILPVRVLGVGGGTTDDIVQGILYAARLPNDAGVLPAKRADVINMSLGGPGLSDATAEAVAAARDAGTIVVASAGNDDTDASYYSPAGEPGVITVGAVDPTKALASYSNYGSVIDVVGPGGDLSNAPSSDDWHDGILSLVYESSGAKLYDNYDGTSMASPHVAAIAALMRSANPALTPDDLDAILDGSKGSPITEDLGPTGRDDAFGYGLLNANLGVLSALELSASTVPQTPTLQLSSTRLDFGAAVDSLSLDATNTGRGTLTVSSMTADAPWVSIAPGATGHNVVTVDRTGLASGIYSATISVKSNGGNVTVAVRASVPSKTVVTGGDVGVVYVLLVDPTTNDVVAEAVTSAADGYAFSLTDVPAGDYELVAGTDLDNSGIINDEGETFGVYPLASDVRMVHVGGDVANLDFPLRVQFDAQIASVGHGGTNGRIRRR